MASQDKTRMTILLNRETAEWLRDAVYYTPGETVASFSEKAIRDRLTDVETKNGKRFPKRDGGVTTGRPVV